MLGSGNFISSIQVGLLLFPAVVSKGHWGKILLEVGIGLSHHLSILVSVETYLFYLGPTFLTIAPGLSCLSDFQELQHTERTICSSPDIQGLEKLWSYLLLLLGPISNCTVQCSSQ